jgi:hypothetical protein
LGRRGSHACEARIASLPNSGGLGYWHGSAEILPGQNAGGHSVRIEKCEDRMTRQVHAVRPLDSIQHARELMEHVIGILTRSDVLDAFVALADAH